MLFLLRCFFLPGGPHTWCVLFWISRKRATPRGEVGLNEKTHPRHMAGGQHQWYHFVVGAPPLLVYVNGDWDVHWGYEILAHGHIPCHRRVPTNCVMGLLGFLMPSTCWQGMVPPTFTITYPARWGCELVRRTCADANWKLEQDVPSLYLCVCRISFIGGRPCVCSALASRNLHIAANGS